jgi:hypothetical protein
MNQVYEPVLQIWNRKKLCGSTRIPISNTAKKKIMTSVFFYLAPARGEEFIKFLASQPQQGIFTPEQRVIFSAFLELGKILATKSMGQYFTFKFLPHKVIR